MTESGDGRALNAAAVTADGGWKHGWGPVEGLAATVEPKWSCCNRGRAQACGPSAASDEALGLHNRQTLISNWIYTAQTIIPVNTPTVLRV